MFYGIMVQINETQEGSIIMLYDIECKSGLQKKIKESVCRIISFIENKSIFEFKIIGYMDDCVRMTNGKDFVRLHKNGYMYITFCDNDAITVYCFDIRNNKVLYVQNFDFLIRINFPSVYVNKQTFSDITKKVPQDLINEYKRLYISLAGV